MACTPRLVSMLANEVCIEVAGQPLASSARACQVQLRRWQPILPHPAGQLAAPAFAHTLRDPTTACAHSERHHNELC
eukprot:scaffold291346_cov17-Tisochrysis_lutea.AAC.1